MINSDVASPTLPTEVSKKLSIFDRFASRASDFVSRGWFFLLCVLLMVLWTPSFLLLQSMDTWQLIINTLTTIVTFLLVALLQNTQKRSDSATQHKLNALADALADVMYALSQEHQTLSRERDELIASVGLEYRESAS